MTVVMQMDGWFVYTKEQRFQTQSPHFMHSPRHQGHLVDMANLQRKNGPEKGGARIEAMTTNNPITLNYSL